MARVLPEEARVQRAVVEGIGGSLRDLYDISASLPDRLEGLLARPDGCNSSFQSPNTNEQKT
jgi:hypothetical protein